jgi:hypothetical protein
MSIKEKNEVLKKAASLLDLLSWKHYDVDPQLANRALTLAGECTNTAALPGQQWAASSPKKAGWYWVYPAKGAPLYDRKPFICQLDSDDIRIKAVSFGNNDVRFDQIEAWMRIETPKVPK